MSACEECWNAAYVRSRVSGGSHVDHYYDLLRENPEHADPEEPTS